MAARDRGGMGHGERAPFSVLQAKSALVVALALTVPPVRAANWAQPFGDNDQNVALTAAIPFTARYGHAMVPFSGRYSYIETAEAAGVTSRSVDTIFLLGGDDHDQEKGGGGYRNDVWRSAGLNWTVVRNFVTTDE